MFGEDPRIKELKRKLQAAGCDMSVVKTWQKQLDRITKMYPVAKNQYQSARQNLDCAKEAFSRMEDMLMLDFAWSQAAAKEMAMLRKELRHYKDAMDHEFLVSGEDQEFHSTFQTIIKLMDGYDGKNRVILKSEVENIRHMADEILERPMPGLIALSYFYVNHDDSELVDIPPKQRLALIEQGVEEEFWKPILEETKMAGIEPKAMLALVKEIVDR